LGKIGRHRPPGFAVFIARITTHHPGQAPGAVLRCFAAAISGGKQIGILGKPAEQAIDVGHGGEKFSHQGYALVADQGIIGRCHDRGADNPRIDKFTGVEALEIVSAPGDDLVAEEGDDIGGGAADIED